MLKHELQALAIDVKCLDENGNEVDLRKQDEDSTPLPLPIMEERKPVDSLLPSEEAEEDAFMDKEEADGLDVDALENDAFEETLDEEKEA